MMLRGYSPLIRKLLLVVSISMLCTSPSFGDDVVESIEEAEKHYRNEDYNEAIKELEFAASLIRKKKSERLKEIFPAPLQGWETDEPEITGTGQTYLGGGIRANQEYRKGEARVTIEIIMDNPILQGILTVLDNPMLLVPEAEPQRVKGQRAISTFDSSAKEGELNLVFKRKVLITLRGYGIDSVDTLRTYAEGVQYKELEKLVDL